MSTKQTLPNKMHTPDELCWHVAACLVKPKQPAWLLSHRTTQPVDTNKVLIAGGPQQA